MKKFLLNTYWHEYVHLDFEWIQFDWWPHNVRYLNEHPVYMMMLKMANIQAVL